MSKTVNFKTISPLVLSFLLVYSSSVNATSGKEIFKINCQQCHGEHLHGDMPGVPDLVINRAWTQKPASKIHRFVKEGTEASGKAIVMPAKGGNPHLSDDEITSALQYMREKVKNNH